MKNLQDEKNILREKYRKLRQKISNDYANFASRKLIEIFQKNIPLSYSSVVAGYKPIDCEINILPLLNHLQQNGHQILLPSIDKKNNLLIFQECSVKFCIDHYSLEQQLNSNVISHIMIMIIPLVAFDKNCHRLGFGKGYYDRTIANYKTKNCIFIGVGYEDQCHEGCLPIASHDQKLNLIITEKNVYRCN